MAGDWWRLALDNLSNQERVEQKLRYRSSRSSAEWVVEDPTGLGGLLPLGYFEPVHVQDGSAAQAAGMEPIGTFPWIQVDMVDRNGRLQAVSSALIGGNSFQVTNVGT